MKLIRKLGTRANKKGHKVRWAIFLCPFCLQEVERRLFGGLKAKSCGCQTKEIQRNANIGKKVSEISRQKMAKAKIGIKRTEESRKKQGDSVRGKKHVTEEGKRRISESKIGIQRTEETRQKVSKTRIEKGIAKGKNNPNWQNGKSFEIYPQEFNKDLKQSILERDNYTCQCPDCEHRSERLDIHHIDFNKKNNNSENLITLCHVCHAKTIGKNIRNFYMLFYQNIMINRVMECLL